MIKIDYSNEKERMKHKDLLTVLETGPYIGVGKSALDRYRKEDDFPQPVMVYGRVFFRRAELDKWAEKYRKNGNVFEKDRLGQLELLSDHETLYYVSIGYNARARRKASGDFPEEIRRYGGIYYRREDIDKWIKTHQSSKSLARK